MLRYQYQQRKEGLLPRTPDNLFSPQKIRCHHPKCPKMLGNHCGGSNSGAATKLTNLQEQSKQSNNQINSIQSAALNNTNHDDILSDNSEIQSLNNTLSATMDEKQKMLLLKIANNSIAAASAVASVADNDYGNVSVSCQLFSMLFTINIPFFLLLIFAFWLQIHSYSQTECVTCINPCLNTLIMFYIKFLLIHIMAVGNFTEFSELKFVESTNVNQKTWIICDVQ